MRLKILFSIIIISFFLLFGSLFYAQIIKGPYYKNLSEENRIVVIPLKSPRGKIYDRKGKIIVDNRISFNVELIYSKIENADELASLLSDVLKIEKENLIAKLDMAKNRPFAPTVLAEDVGRETAVILEQYKIDYPGILVTTKAKRNYLYGNIASGIIGYLGRINTDELKRLKAYGYRVTDLIGRAGLEKQYDGYLRGSYGGMQVEVDAAGRQKNILHTQEPMAGKDLYLTIDIDLQEYCDKVMEERRGSIICMDPVKGGILALVTKPNFDPSFFIKSGEKKEAEDILNNVTGDYPLLNRGISCAYPPGSIFKTVVALAALETGKFDNARTLFCGGKFRFSGRTAHCWREGGHGIQVLEEAIKNSCNVFFYQLGLLVGVDDMAFYGAKLGFGAKTGIDLPWETEGLLPGQKWKKSKMKENWYPGDTINYSIGQGYLLATPIQVVRAMSVFANRGNLLTPYILDRIQTIESERREIDKLDASPESIDIVRNGLRKVVNDPYGTGMKARLDDIVFSGKTGTAQNPTGKTHGWFAGFAPFDNPKIAVVVFVEFGGKGGVEASIMARKVVEKAKEIGII